MDSLPAPLMPGGRCLQWGQGTLGQGPEQPGLRCSHPDPRRTPWGASRDLLGPSASHHLWPDAPGGDRKTKRRPETQRENGQKRDGQLGTHIHSGSPGDRAQETGRQKRRGKETNRDGRDRGRHANRDQIGAGKAPIERDVAWESREATSPQPHDEGWQCR